MKKFNKGLIASLAVVTAGTVGSVVAVTANQLKVDNVNNDQPSIVEPIDTRPKVEFVTKGGSAIETQHVDNGSTIEEPVSIRGGYKIVGWFLDQACSKPYDFNTPVTEDIKLYALWRTEFTFDIVTSSEGATCTVTGYNGTDTDITIPSEYEGLSVTAIAPSAFASWSSRGGSRYVNLTSVIIPDTITEIGDEAFKDCGPLISVTLSSTVKKIGNGVFSGCSNLTNISLPESLETLGNQVFYGCKKLSSITTIPSHVTSFGEKIFASSGLTTYTVPSSMTVIPSGEFEECKNLTSITIPNTVTSIGSYAFKGSGITSIIIPDNVRDISVGLFYNCENLTNVVLPNNLVTIEDYAFFACSSLKSITIPRSVTSIGMRAFSYCRQLTSIVIPSNVTHMGAHVFENDYNDDVTVFCEAKEKPSEWHNAWDARGNYIPNVKVVWGYKSV